MKAIQTFLILLCLLSQSCKKKDDINGGGNPTNSASNIIFENNTFSGSCIVTFSDGTTYNGTFENGKMGIPATGSGKIIATIQPQNQQLIIIGREEGDTIKLNYNGTILAHRTAVNGYVPIGTFAEFQLVNSNSTTLAASYKQEDTLYFMNNVWTPIGNTTAQFNGAFDGNNFEIYGINVSLTGANTFAGLFGYASSNSQFNNIIIGSGSVKGQTAAGIAAECGFISNCKNYANIEGSIVAGVAVDVRSTNNEISNCHNYGFLLSSGDCAGVFLNANGSLQTTIKNCTNNNILNGANVYGIVMNTHYLKDCINYGAIATTGIGSAAGIVGSASSILNCTNNGNISGGRGVYGIVKSGFSIGTNSSVENCTNTGNLIATNATICEGIGGGGTGTVKNCNNSGNIISTAISSVNFVSGISGQCNITNCHNTGNLDASSNDINYKPQVGGICATTSNASTFNFSDCSNTGNINATIGSAGGIVGGNFGNTIKRCFNSGNISGEYAAGGICGLGSSYTNTLLTISSCYNTGEITSTISTYGINSGGIIGLQDQIGNYKIEKCYNLGTCNGGGILGVSLQNNVGNFTFSLTNCFWKQGTATFAIAKILGAQGVQTSSNTGANLFSATAWPSASTGWTATDWKSLGGWNNGNPTYPKLIFEN